MVKRVCLISPGHVAFNPRLVKEANALSSAGYAVHVIAANNLKNLRPLDEPILTTADWSFELVGGDNIVFDVLRRARSKLAKILLSRSRLESCRLFEWAHHSLIDPLKAAARRHRADLYIAHYVAAMPAAYLAAQHHSTRWSFDAEDYHIGQFLKSELENVAARSVSAIERAYLPKAHYFTAASDGIAAAYVRDYQLPQAGTILNVFPRANAPVAATSAGRVRPGPSLYWFSQTIGINRGLECAVRAIALAKSKPHLYLRGNLQAGIVTHLEKVAQRFDVVDRIHFLPLANAAEMERLAADYDIGFVGEVAQTENQQIALANKLFSFLLAGLPVVASDIEAHRAVANTCSAVTTFSQDDSIDLARAIDDLLLDPKRLERARLKSWTVGQNHYNWDLEQQKVITAVSNCIGPPTDGHA